MIQQPTDHAIPDCPHPQASMTRLWIDQVIRQIVDQSRDDGRRGYEPYAACFGCHSPQWMCHGWESNGYGGYRKTGRACQYPHVAIQIIGQLLHGPKQQDIRLAWQQRMREQFPTVDISEAAQLIGHFQRRFGRRGEERSGLVVEMNWMCVFMQREFPP
jgi:hypothetical protein